MWQFQHVGAFPVFLQEQKETHTWERERERKETEFTVDGLFSFQMEGKVKGNRFFHASDTMEGLMMKKLNLQPLSSGLSYLVGFRVELLLNYLKTHLHKVYVCDHVLEAKRILPCAQESIKGCEQPPEYRAFAISQSNRFWSGPVLKLAAAFAQVRAPE